MIATLNEKTAVADFLPLQGTDYVEFYVGNAKQASHYYRCAFGFQPLAYAGPETGRKDVVSYAVRQHKLTFVFTSSLRPDHPIAEHVRIHGDGVKILALKVEDAASAWQETTSRGGVSYLEPQTQQDEQGSVVLSGICTYGDTVHLFVERRNYQGTFLPGYRSWTDPHFRNTDTGLLYVDHCVGNVGWNQMNTWVQFYEQVMGFRNILTFDDQDISTEYSALMSKVMSNSQSTNRLKEKRNRRSKNTWIITRVQAYSTWHSQRMTSSIPFANLKAVGLNFFRYLIHITMICWIAWVPSMKTCNRSGNWGFWSTAMKKAIFCSSFPNPFRIALPYSLRSSSEKERKVSAKEISRLSLKRSSGNRKKEAICKHIIR